MTPFQIGLVLIVIAVVTYFLLRQSGVIRARSVQRSHIKLSPIRHQKLSDSLDARIRVLEPVFAEVYPLTHEAWLDGFQRDAHPEREIALWETMAAAYQSYTGKRSLSLDARKEVFGLLLVRSAVDEQHTISGAKLQYLSRADAEEVVRLYSTALQQSSYEKRKVRLFSSDPPVPPPGPRPQCRCFNFNGNKHHGLPVLHAEVQDTASDAWRIVNEKIEAAVTRGDTVLEPLAGLDGGQRQQIITLPVSIGRLKNVRELRLYGSHLVRLPPEIAGMTALEYLDVYTSYRLHFFPYELTRCKSLRRSRVSTRALYGNCNHRPPFPHLKLPENRDALSLVTPAFCSVCARPLSDSKPVRRWITLSLGTDYMPLLVTACSMDCIKSLPTPHPDYVQEAHTGGHHIVQPPPRY
jgi:hypothetical protein